jgi:hypothetical protein
MIPTRFVFLLPILFGACGGAEKDRCEAASQDEALDCLGVPPDDSPRVDSAGTALPASYSPLGPRAEVGVSRELFVAGMQIAPPVPTGDPVLLESRAVTVALADDATHQIGTAVLDTVAPGTIWEIDEHSSHPSQSASQGGQSTRAATAADLDGDGADEIVVAYLDPSDPVNDGVIFIDIAGADAPVTVTTAAGATDVAIAAIDADGDGDDELAIAAASGSEVTVILAERDASGRIAAIADTARQLAVVAGGAVSTELAAGNLDRDAGDELVVVVNESGTDGGAVSRYRVFDDAAAGFGELTAASPIRVEDGGSFEAAVADVAVADIDADGTDEIVFGGLDEIVRDTCTAHLHLYLALDDAGDSPEPMAVLGQLAEPLRYLPSSGCDEVASELPVSHVFVNAVDIDGDGVSEIQANLRVFDDFTAGAFTELFAVDPQVLSGPDERGGSALSAATTAMEVADINGDGKGELIIFAQHRNRIAVWGLDGPNLESAEFREVLEIETAFYNSQTRVFPIIAAANVDSDGAVLQYSAVEYRFVFTEPVIIAALAAAPCIAGIDQNLEACTTSYGTSETTSGGVDGSVSVSASTFVSFEAKDPFFGLGVEGRSSLTATASFSAARSYSLTESVEYTTGGLEDTVIFTTVPLDQYTYRVVAHPDPELVGTEIVINLPRSPITLQVEREFYNDSVVEGSFQVGSNVFLHSPGDIDSYPDEADADALIDTGGLGHIGPLGELVDSAGEALGPLAETLLGDGIKASRAVTVGEGSGQTTTEIVFSESTEYRAGAEIAYEAELAVTGGGVGVGMGVGVSAGAGISWGGSQSTTYRGTIGSIGASDFSDNIYSAGLFTYVFNYGNPEAPQFEVINYWVDRSERN